MNYKNLSLDEKISLLTGEIDGSNRTKSLNGKVYSLRLEDGPIGLHQPPVIWMPSITSLSCTWNLDIVKDFCNVIADVMVINNLDVILGPAMNIKRLATCGRNFEYISEDPYLTGCIAKEYVTTIQNRGIMTCPKHFCCNNREFARLTCSSNVDERALREIYTKAFEMVCEDEKEAPGFIMCSYNKINGEHAAENVSILKELLRDKLHYKNVIVSDWGAVHERGKALKATLDLEMPYIGWHDPDEEIRNAIKNGEITIKDVDDSIDRIERVTNRILEAKKNAFVMYSEEKRREIAIKINEEAIVLLKNKGNILPLKDGQKIGIIGHHAVDPALGGGGSNNLGDDPVKPFDERFEITQKSLQDSLQELLPNSVIGYANGYEMHRGFGNTYRSIFGVQVKRVCESSDVVLFYAGTNRSIECEGYDRESLSLPKVQLQMLEFAIKYSKKVVVIIEAGSVIDVSPFKDRVAGIIYTGFGGETILQSMANVLTGKVNPSGKLTESFISSIEDNPYIDKEPDLFEEDYRDGILVGYRLYDTENIKVNYEFGYGLSYTSFAYSNLKITQLSGDTYEISYQITNVGDREGKEISQVYIGMPNSKIQRAKKELKGFDKASLKPGESKEIKIALNKKSFAYFDTEIHDWIIEKGKYDIYVGSSSKNIRLTGEIEIE